MAEPVAAAEPEPVAEPVAEAAPEPTPEPEAAPEATPEPEAVAEAPVDATAPATGMLSRQMRALCDLCALESESLFCLCWCHFCQRKPQLRSCRA